MTREQVIEEISTATLRGRGGAGFPMGRKLSLVQPPEVAGKPTYVVANADESEPGSFKDREIMRRVPHRFIEGCLIAAHAIGSKHVFIYIRGEYAAEYEVLKARRRRGARRRTCSATSRSSSTAAPAPTSAARSPRSSSRSRATAASRGRGRRSRRSRACTPRRR